MKFLRANIDVHQSKPRPVLINLNSASFVSHGNGITGTKVLLPDEFFVIIESLDDIERAIIDQSSDPYTVIKPKRGTT